MTEKNIRYDRQERIDNWDQEKLAGARVAIVGTGQLSHFTAASLVALGIGSVDLYKGNEGSGFLTPQKSGANALEKKLHEMNPDVEVRGIENQEFSSNRYDLVLDLTNSSESKERTLKYSAEHGSRTISASTGKTGGEMYFVKPGEGSELTKLAKYSGEEQGAFSSEVLGGMVTEEVRKALMPIRAGEGPVRSIAYNATAERRFSKEGDFDAQPYEDLARKRVLIVGAGALGNFAALGMALEGIGEIDILDFDEVDSTNLNRQILFYDAVGKKKSLALAEKLREINPHIKIRGIDGKLDENSTYLVENTPDVILDCVDSFATRAIINHYAVKNQIPLVSGGTNPSSGQVVVYEPGKSACLECKLHVESALGMALNGSKCKDTPDPSVIMTNEVIGGMMVGEALKVLDKGYGAPVTRILKYDSTNSARGGLVGTSESCDCTMPETHEWLQEVKERFSFGKNDEEAGK